MPEINAKRVYRIMRQNALLLERKAVATLCAQENIDKRKVAALLDYYLFTDVTPREDEVARILT
ncbi:MAG: hypothetical protein E7G19_02150 [Klebsiella michiganensis]|nr:hypothetical protein [Klebsiella michiganensis]